MEGFIKNISEGILNFLGAFKSITKSTRKDWESDLMYVPTVSHGLKNMASSYEVQVIFPACSIPRGIYAVTLANTKKKTARDTKHSKFLVRGITWAIFKTP